MPRYHTSRVMGYDISWRVRVLIMLYCDEEYANCVSLRGSPDPAGGGGGGYGAPNPQLEKVGSDLRPLPHIPGSATAMNASVRLILISARYQNANCAVRSSASVRSPRNHTPFTRDAKWHDLFAENGALQIKSL